MSDVLAITVILLFVGCAYPGLLVTLRLLFPGVVQNNQQRIASRPWRCFWSGALAALVMAVPVLVLVNLPGGLPKLLGWLLGGLGLALSTLGAAGLAGLMAARLQSLPADEAASSGAFVRAALALELAAIFPVVGWLVFFPASLFVSLGAALLTWLRGAPAPAVNTLLALRESEAPGGAA